MLRRARRNRLVRTLVQFRYLRLQLAGVTGVALLVVGLIVDPQSTLGVVAVSLGTGVITSALVSAIVLEREEFAQVVIRLGVQDIFHDRRAAFTNDFWTSLIDYAEQRFCVLGVANHGYARNETIRAETRTALMHAIRDRGVQVEFLWLNPQHQLAQIREEEEGERGTRRDIVNCIRWFAQLRAELPEAERSLLSLREHTAMPTCGITWADDLVVVTHYLAQQLNLESPGLVLGPSMSLVDRLVDLVRRAEPRRPAITEAYVSNYREISATATPITDDRVTELEAFLETLGPDARGRRSEAEIRAELEHDGNGRSEGGASG